MPALKLTKTTLKNLPMEQKGLRADVAIWPIEGSTSFGVAVKIEGKAYKSKLVKDKQELLKFLEAEL